MEILSNETVKRITNIGHENLEIGEQVRVLEQLRNSGYSMYQAREIIVLGVRYSRRKREKKLLERETWYLARLDQGENKKEKMEGRKIVRGFRRLNHKRITREDDSGKVKKEQIVKAVMFSPCTRRGELVKELRESENTLGRKTRAKLKIMERCGTKIVDIFMAADPKCGQDYP